ncbi:YDG domain-containing protein [Paucibacter sp. B2R-40]|uniref:YDG domain-containing protein n=1 Tax=Paucibacter sp. B2R-40 TaxID=2893554 RepID=UPI0021E35DE7|nr:YDG domain-containing protein [Paucibacter sp. B2R-40]MCV2355110.1 YDG domain-containing protein [Paucibacter sp. B2R-40]
MNEHASINRLYRLIWNASTGTWVAVSELSRARGKRSNAGASGISALLAALKALPLSLALGLGCVQAAPPVNTVPQGGQVVAGQASISSGTSAGGARLDVNQSSQRAAIDWQSFNLGANAQINFKQPDAASVILNRVLDAQPSQIFGRITSNGQVFLSNPAGIYFSPTASADVGALVATTHSISTADFIAGKTTFDRNGSTASVINAGSITSSLGGYVALLAPEVRNEGVILAQAGTVALAAGEMIELQFNGTRLSKLLVSPASVAALVDNRQAVLAPDGLILLTARGAQELSGGVIQHSGKLQANSLSDKGGRIVLEADTITLAAGSSLDASGAIGGGQVLVGGDWQGAGAMHQASNVTMAAGAKIDASAGQVGDGGTVVLWSDVHNPLGVTSAHGEILAQGGSTSGIGGQVETSSHKLDVNGIRVSTAAPTGQPGQTGRWLLDPYDFTIAASGGDISGADLATLLVNSNITIQTALSPTASPTNLIGNSGTAGDILIKDALSWSANKLTLSAYNNITVSANLNASATASLALEFGLGAVATGNTSNFTTAAGAAVNLPAGSSNFTTRQGSNGTLKNYTVINSAGVTGSVTKTDLQGMHGDRTLNYALGANIDATGVDFLPIGTNIGPYAGSFDGLGHQVSNLTINQAGKSDIGLFNKLAAGATIKNVGLLGGSISGLSNVGALVGDNAGTVSNSYATSQVTGSGSSAGGLLGKVSAGTVSNSFATGPVTGSGSAVGGLVGTVTGGTVSASYASGNVSGASDVGGLVGLNSGGNGLTPASQRSPGTGVAGANGSNALITNSYATGSATGTGSNVGGLVGRNLGGNGGRGGDATTVGAIGGKGGNGGSASISNSYATGAATGSTLGGLAGARSSGSSGTIGRYLSGSTAGAGGSGGTASTNASYWNTSTSGNATSAAGTGKNTAQMQAMATFSGWTISTSPASSDMSPWFIYEGQTAPLLRSFLTPLSVTVGNVSRTYDGQTYGDAPALSYSLTPNANLLGSLSWVNAKNAGSYAASGSLHSNQQGYLISVAGGTLTVNPATLNLQGTRSYDGSTAFAGAQLSAIGVHGETFSVSGAGQSGNLSSKQVQTNQALASIDGLSLGSSNNGGLAGNYNALGTAGSSVSITPASVTVSGLTAHNKTYDGSTTASLNSGAAAFTGMIAADHLNVASASGAFVDKNAGSGKTVNISGITLGGADAGNYALSNTSASSTADISKAPLTVTADSKSRIYGAANPALTTAISGFVNGETLANSGVTGSAGATTSATTATGVGNAIISAGIGSLTASNYVFNSFTDGTLTINKAHLSVTADDKSRTYGAANPSLTTTISGFGNGETLATSGVSGNAGATTSATTATAVGSAIINASPGSLAASNYDFTTLTNGTLSIDKAHLTVTADDKSRLYGAANPALTTTISGFVNGETLANSGISGSASASTPAGAATSAGLSNITPAIGTLSASNYDFPLLVDGRLDISKAPLLVTATPFSKTYDGQAFFGGNGAAYSGLVNSESAAVLAGALSFAGSSQGARKVGRYVLTPTGLSSANYTINYADAALEITRASISAVTGISAADKIYDGSTAASLNNAGAAFTGMMVGDRLTVASASGSFADKNAGIAKSVSISGLSLGGEDAGNYSLSSNVASAQATIERAAISDVSGISANSKTYDGTNAATLNASQAVFTGKLAGDALNVAAASASFADKGAGTGKPVSISNITLGGGDAANYRLLNPSASSQADIAKALITAITGITANNKVEDGSRVASLKLDQAILTGRIGADLVSIAQAQGNFDNALPGLQKTVMISELQLGGADAGNYQLAAGIASTQADIGKKAALSEPTVLPPYPPQPSVTPATRSQAPSTAGLVASSPPAAAAPAALAGPNAVTPSNGGNSNSNSSSNGNGNGNGGRSNAGVTAVLTRLPSAEQPGIASILIPLSSAAAGEGFKFSLPQELVAAMGSSGAAASVSSLNGEALPSWLRFDADSRNFVANAVPAGALPYQVRITVGGQVTVIMMGAASD